MDDEGFVTLNCRCLPEHRHNALYPILEMFKRHLGLQDASVSEMDVERLCAVLEPCGWPVEVSLPILCSWLFLPLPEPFTAVQHAPARQKQILLEVLKQWILNCGDGQPLLLIMEDLHWIDQTGIELLNRLVDASSDGSMLLVLTARPEFCAPWDAEHVRHLSLTRLADHHTKAMIQHVLGGKAIEDDTWSRLSERVDGIPLFAEELVRMLLDRCAFIECGGAYALSERFDETSIPVTLRGMLNERLDSLGTAKETAQMAAAIGRHFDYRLLMRASFRNAAQVQADLDQLIAADLAYRQRHVQGDAFSFRHALIRDTAYDGMPQFIRKQVHASIAATLETHFPEVVEVNPVVHAQHFASAHAFDKAVYYGTKAAKASQQRSLNDETLSHTRDVLEWLSGLEPAARPEAELDISRVITQAMMGKYGWADPRVKARVDRSRELLRQLPGSPHTVPTLWSLATYHHVAGNRKGAREVADELFQVAEASDDLGLKVAATTMLGIKYRADGPYEKAAEVLRQALALYDPDLHRHHGTVFGLDTRAWAAGTLAMVCWFAGESTDAAYYAEDAVTWSRTINHVPSLGLAMLQYTLLQHHRGDRDATRESSVELLALADKYGLPAYEAYARVLHCWAADDLPLALDVLDKLRSIECRLALQFYSSLPADIEMRQGRVQAAIERICYYLALCREYDQLNYEAELYRRRAMYALEVYPSGNIAILEELTTSATLARNMGMLRTEAEALVTLLQYFRGRSQQCEHRLQEIIALRPELSVLQLSDEV